MRRILLTVAYDGTDYHGWQIQNNGRTIEGELNRAINKLTGEVIEVIGASRTDAGVHGMCNRAVFDTESTIPADRFYAAINTLLPDDIRVTSSKEVEPDWHPRKVSTHKTYEYVIDNEEVANPKLIRYSWHVRGNLSIEKMNEAAGYLKGEHDFTSFCCVNGNALTNVRTIIDIGVYKKDNLVTIRVTGNGFLYNMVRIIAGTLVNVGLGRTSPEDINKILEAKDRTKAGPTAPPQGLTLVEIKDIV